MRRRVPVRGRPAHLCEAAEREWSGPAGVERLVFDRVIRSAAQGRTGRPINGGRLGTAVVRSNGGDHAGSPVARPS